MSPQKQWLVCEHCRTKELFYKPEINHGLHIALIVFTAGLWLISYVAVLIGQFFQPWECEACRHQQYPPKQLKPERAGVSPQDAA